MENADGVYHIINRGNYRRDLFMNKGAHLAFENCLFEACEKCDCILEGFCVMTELSDYRWSSYWYLVNAQARPDFLDCSGALEAGGGLGGYG